MFLAHNAGEVEATGIHLLQDLRKKDEVVSETRLSEESLEKCLSELEKNPHWERERSQIGIDRPIEIVGLTPPLGLSKKWTTGLADGIGAKFTGSLSCSVVENESYVACGLPPGACFSAICWPMELRRRLFLPFLGGGQSPGLWPCPDAPREI